MAELIKSTQQPKTLLLGCRALAKEMLMLSEQLGEDVVDVHCLPADLHNRPGKIPAKLDQALEKFKPDYLEILVVYGDCGTGGKLDEVCDKHQVARIPGAHCYQFFMGHDAFNDQMQANPACFFLTDFMVRHFDRLVMQGLGLDRHPDLLPMYFGNYTGLIYLAQVDDPELDVQARECAQKLGLNYERRELTGLDEMQSFIAQRIKEQQVVWAKVDSI